MILNFFFSIYLDLFLLAIGGHPSALPLAAVLIALTRDFMEGDMNNARAKRNFDVALA